MFGPTHYILQTRPLLDFRQTNRETTNKRERERERERERLHHDNIERQTTVNININIVLQLISASFKDKK